MAKYTFETTETQENALIALGASTVKERQTIINEQCFYYLKKYLLSETPQAKEVLKGQVLTDEQATELAAIVTTETINYIATLTPVEEGI